VLWVNQFALLPADGGGTRHFELGRELVRHGWNVTIVAADLHLHKRTYTRRSSARDRRPVVEVVDGVELRWLWTASYVANDWRRLRNWLGFRMAVLRDGLGASVPDVVIGSSPQLFAAAAARTLAQRLRVPFVFEVRDLWPESLEAIGGRRGLAYAYLARLANGLYRDADRVLVLARGVADYLEKHGVPARKIILVPNGVDVATLPPDTPASPPQAPAGLTLVYAGAHGPANGLEQVLDAAARLQNELSVRFQLIGDGPAKNALRNEAERRRLTNVEFHDAVSKPQLLAMMRSADAGLMVLKESHLFSFGVSPNKLFDYLGAAIPVICNVPGEVAEMLRSAEAGIQVSDSGGAALAEGVRRLAATTAEQRARMGINGQAWVTRNHGRDVLGKRLDGYLRELLPER
jgi:glycosyltransferase involved in cell wall biosynthesis